MNNNFLILVRANFRMLWGGMKYSKRKKRFLSLPLLLIGVVLLVLLMVSNAVGQTMVFLQEGHPEGAIYSAVSTAVMLAFLLAVMRGGTTNTSNDADFLLSLPIKRHTILLSKSVSRYLFDLGPVALFLLPSVVVYYIMAQQSVALLLRGILVMFMIPMLSVGIAYIFSYLMFKISGKFSRSDLVRSALVVVISVGFLVFYMAMSGTMGMGGNMAEFVSNIAPLAWGADFAVYGSIASFLFFAMITAAPFLLGVALQARIYGQKLRIWRSGKTELEFRKRSPMRALFRKEIRFYFSIPIYVFNTIFSPIMAVVGTVAVVAARDNVLGLFANNPEFAIGANMLAFLVFAVACFFPAMTYITASSISLEGKNIRILRASPLDEKDIFLSKIGVHLLIIVPAIFVCMLVSGLAVNMTFLQIVLTELAIAALSVLIALWGLYVNLIFPKLDWDNEVTVVKQSMATMISVFTGFIPAALPIVLFLAVFQNDFVMSAAVSLIAFIILSAIVWLLLMTDGRKRYREL